MRIETRSGKATAIHWHMGGSTEIALAKLGRVIEYAREKDKEALGELRTLQKKWEAELEQDK